VHHVEASEPHVYARYRLGQLVEALVSRNQVALDGQPDSRKRIVGELPGLRLVDGRVVVCLDPLLEELGLVNRD
jgi:hypothetical protein